MQEGFTFCSYLGGPPGRRDDERRMREGELEKARLTVWQRWSCSSRRVRQVELRRRGPSCLLAPQIPRISIRRWSRTASRSVSRSRSSKGSCSSSRARRRSSRRWRRGGSCQSGKDWTFNLRKGVKFHDNTPFNAAAVCANFNRQYNSRGRSRMPRRRTTTRRPSAGSSRTKSPACRRRSTGAARRRYADDRRHG